MAYDDVSNSQFCILKQRRHGQCLRPSTAHIPFTVSCVCMHPAFVPFWLTQANSRHPCALVTNAPIRHASGPHLTWMALAPLELPRHLPGQRSAHGSNMAFGSYMAVTWHSAGNIGIRVSDVFSMHACKVMAPCMHVTTSWHHSLSHATRGLHLDDKIAQGVSAPGLKRLLGSNIQVLNIDVKLRMAGNI